jgi:hypothetical protein
MLTKEVLVGLIEIYEDGRLGVRQDTVVTETTDKGVEEISRTYVRYMLEPGDDVIGKPQRVQDVANLLWTPEVIDAWKIKQIELRKNPLVGPTNG